MPRGGTSATVDAMSDVLNQARADERAGLRERKRLRTERELRERAMELFSERGFDHVTIDDIADAADVSKRTFYRYFDSKEDVILSDPDERFEQIRMTLAARPADEPILIALRATFATLAGSYEMQRDEMQCKWELMHGTPSLQARGLEHEEQLGEAMAQLIAQRMGEPVDALAPRLLAAHVWTTLRLTVEHWLAQGGDAGDDTASLHVLLDHSLELLEQGFRATP